MGKPFWGLRDTLAFESVSKAGKSLLDAWEQAEAGKAYKEGSQATTPESPDRIAAYREQQDLANAPRVDSAGTPVYDNSDFMEGGAGLQANREDKRAEIANRYGQAANEGAKWRLGGKLYDTEPGRIEKHRAGLMAQAERLFSMGRGEEGGKLLERASNLEDAEQRRALGSLQITQTQRAIKKSEAQETADREVSDLITKSHQYDSGSPEHKAIIDEVNKKITSAYGAAEGQRYAKEAWELGEKKREAEIKKRSDAMFVASKSPEATVEAYNKNFKDGMTAKLVENKDGTKSIIQVNENGEQVGEMMRFKDWEREGRPKVLLGIPEFAKEEYKRQLAHTSRMEEIRAQGDQHVRYAQALAGGRDKTIKLSNTEKARFAELDKALQEAGDDPKKLAAAYRNMHTFNNAVRMAHGQLPQPWSGGGATDKAPPPMPLTDYLKLREAVEVRLRGNKEYSKLDAASLEAAIDRETQKQMGIISGSANVRGLQGGGQPSAGAPAGGGMGAVAALAKQAGAAAPPAGGDRPSAPRFYSPDDKAAARARLTEIDGELGAGLSKNSLAGQAALMLERRRLKEILGIDERPDARMR